MFAVFAIVISLDAVVDVVRTTLYDCVVQNDVQVSNYMIDECSSTKQAAQNDTPTIVDVYIWPEREALANHAGLTSGERCFDDHRNLD